MHLESLCSRKVGGEKDTEMDMELFKAAVKGDVSFLTEAHIREMEGGSDEYFLRKTREGNNMIHIGVRYRKSEFVHNALMSFPELIGQTNCSGNTPLHIAAEIGDVGIVELLVTFYEKRLPVLLEDHIKLWQSPLKMKNTEGNTPLHIALIRGNIQVASSLLDVAPEVASVVNNSKEAPLHLAVKYHIDGDMEFATSVATLLRDPRNFKDYPPKENSLQVIERLLGRDSSVASWCDTDGLTPLLQASMSGYLAAVGIITEHCPQAVEKRDSNGRTVLHLLKKLQSYQEGKDLLSLAAIKALIDQQDCSGNTPAHLAVRNHDFKLVKVLSSFSANFTIKNNNGVSVDILILELSFCHHTTPKIEAAIGEESPERLAEEFFYDIVNWEHRDSGRASDVFLKMLEDSENDVLLFRSPQGGNVLHQALHFFINGSFCDPNGKGKTRIFIYKAAERFPILISQADNMGNTPLHTLAEMKSDYMMDMLSHFVRNYKDYLSNSRYSCCPPWRVKNLQGNTPLHLAVRETKWLQIIKYLVELDTNVLQFVNNRMETALHIMCSSKTTIPDHDANTFFKISGRSVFMLDRDGMSPLLRAAQAGNIEYVNIMLCHDSRIADICDPNGKTFWHLLIIPFLNFGTDNVERLIKNPTASPLLYARDYDGNSPLHAAIERGEYKLAELLVAEDRNLLEQENNKKEYPHDLVGRSPDILVKLGNSFRPGGDRIEWIGVRSMYGVPIAEIKVYNNSIAMVAVLIATITFTAAFTVPGGLKSDDGSPLLMHQAAFKVFMVSDVVAMCLSMMALFSSLWLITTGFQQYMVILLDFSIFLLQTSFYATLVTFMTGLYVTTVHVTRWIAVFTCVVCSILIVFSHKRLILNLIIFLITTWFVLIDFNTRLIVCYRCYGVYFKLEKLIQWIRSRRWTRTPEGV